MPFDDTKWDAPAAQGDVGFVSFCISSALNSICEALINIKNGGDIDEQIEKITSRSKALDEQSRKLTGYTANAD